MLKNNEEIIFNPLKNSYDFSSCFELTIEDWVELYNLQLDYPVVNYQAVTIEEALEPSPVILPAASKPETSKIPIIACVVAGGVAVTTVAILTTRSRLKSKLIKAVVD